MEPITDKAGATGLLSIFDRINVRKEETITDADRAYCERQQERLYKTLERIEHWYDIFRREAEKYADSHRLKFSIDGIVSFDKPYRTWDKFEPAFTEFEFTPFKMINEMADAYTKAVVCFGDAIVGYFNKTYDIRVPDPGYGRKPIEMGSRPGYQTYVDLVTAHLGGKGFREVAVEEIISRFHKLVGPYMYSYTKKARYELKGNGIAFHDLVRYNDIALSYGKRYDLDYGDDKKIDTLCEGIIMAVCGKLNGNMGSITGFKGNDIDPGKEYSFPCDEQVGVKFYKNGRVDVIFNDKYQAAKHYVKLRLDELAAKCDVK